jgi:hypothetical protein
VFYCSFNSCILARFRGDQITHKPASILAFESLLAFFNRSLLGYSQPASIKLRKHYSNLCGKKP